MIKTAINTPVVGMDNRIIARNLVIAIQIWVTRQIKIAALVVEERL